MKKTAEKPKGMYKGRPSDPATVKKKIEFQGMPIHLDRPKGFIMMGKDSKGNDWARRYKYDYGFIPKTLGGDGDGLDVFIGPKKKAPLAFWVVQRKDDGSFDEYKVFLGFDNRDEALAAYRAHIPKKYFNGMLTMKVEMMKAMLGKVDPNETFDRRGKLSMLNELFWLMENTKTAAMGPSMSVRDQRKQPNLGALHALYGDGKNYLPKKLPKDAHQNAQQLMNLWQQRQGASKAQKLKLDQQEQSLFRRTSGDYDA